MLAGNSAASDLPEISSESACPRRIDVRLEPHLNGAPGVVLASLLALVDFHGVPATVFRIVDRAVLDEGRVRPSGTTQSSGSSACWAPKLPAAALSE